MKFKIMLSMMLLLTSTSMFAIGFPVTRAATATTFETSIVDDGENTAITSPAAGLKTEKSKGIALILFLTLGLLAGHRWYLKRFYGWNIFFILTFGGLGIWALLDLIGIFAGWMKPAVGRYKKSFF